MLGKVIVAPKKESVIIVKEKVEVKPAFVEPEEPLLRPLARWAHDQKVKERLLRMKTELPQRRETPPQRKIISPKPGV